MKIHTVYGFGRLKALTQVEFVTKLIELLNLIPEGHELPDFADLLRSAVPDDGLGGLWNAVRPAVALLPKKIQRTIGPIERDRLRELIEGYEYIRSARELLRGIASNVGPGGKLPNSGALAEPKIDSEWMVRCEISPLMKALEGVDSRKICKCPQCPNLFWKKRKNKPCCSDKCANLRRVLNWQKKWPEKYQHSRYLAAEKRARSR